MTSDKHYWHRYTETYERAFATLGDVRRVVEFGVLHGESIRWLAECFPHAEIIGADILLASPDWPIDPRISYRQVDQSNRGNVAAMLNAIGDVDLIIDDGSHVPEHQATCLAEGMNCLRPGGLYIVEDIGTSYVRKQSTALHVLMAIQHMKDTGQNWDGLFGSEDATALFMTIDRVEIYKRTQLPLQCYACGGSEFDYVRWFCQCGVRLNDVADSMAALVWKKGNLRTTATQATL